MEFVHETVLLGETVDQISPKPGGTYADVTTGGGGHAEAVLERSNPDGSLVAMDRDLHALTAARDRLQRFGNRVRFVHTRMSTVAASLRELGVQSVQGVIADLGVSSPQLDVAERGFSIQRTGPLDMRMDSSQGLTVLGLIDSLTTDALADVLFEYGEERRSRPIARAIHDAHGRNELHTTDDLKAAVYRVTGPKRFVRGRKQADPATRTFQALRIAVNEELSELEALIDQLPEFLEPAAVAAIISFHSLEDRIVKHRFRDDPRLNPLSKKPIVAGAAELSHNPRARSAKLRAARYEPEVAP